MIHQPDGRARVRRIVVVTPVAVTGQAVATALRAKGLDAVASTPLEAVASIGRETSDHLTLVLDGGLGSDHVDACTDAAHRACSELRVVVVGHDRAVAEPSRAVLAVGREIGVEDLVRIVEGGAPPGCAMRPRSHVGSRGDYEAQLVLQLTDRERQVLTRLMSGLGGDAVAASLRISPHTVRTHLQNIFTKLGVHTQVEAAIIGLRAGLRPATEPIGDVA